MITKQELVDKVEAQSQEIERLKKRIVDQGDIQATIDLKDKAVKAEHDAKKKIKELEDLLEEQKVFKEDIQATIDLKDKAVKAEHDVRKQLDLLKQELAGRDKQIKGLSDRLNTLAGLLEQYILAYEEGLKFTEIHLKNSVFAKDALRKKIEDYNKGDIE